MGCVVLFPYMHEHEARTRLSSIGLTDEQIEDVLPFVARPDEPDVESVGLLATRRVDLENQLAATDPKDWRQRASIAARIISLSTE